MKILITPNAFKGCLSAAEAAKEMARGVRRALPRANLDFMPISDGGDGLMEVLLNRWGGRRVSCKVTGPLYKSRVARYALLKDGRTAVIEMAQASGIAGLNRKELDPFRATSFGVGELIHDALRRGARRIVIGMGGSATNDGGAGMAVALGAKFYGKNGKPLPLGAEPLRRLAKVDISGLIIPSPRPLSLGKYNDSLAPRGRGKMKGDRSKVEVLAVSDVTNPLLGSHGSARVYGPQKGATPSMVRVLDSALTRYARILKRDLGRDVAKVPGSGAAGGLGAGLLAFLGARIVPGADWVLDQLDADRRLKRADIVFTGEGKLDAQSFYGKAPIALARRAWAHRTPVAFLCGQVEREALRRLPFSNRFCKVDRAPLLKAFKLSTEHIPGYVLWISRMNQFWCVSLTRPGEKPEQAMRAVRTRLRAGAEDITRKFLEGGSNA